MAPATHTAEGHLLTYTYSAIQAQQRGVKQAAPTQPDADDPCASHWGDYPMVQSTEISGRQWTRVEELTPDKAGQEVS